MSDETAPAAGNDEATPSLADRIETQIEACYEVWALIEVVHTSIHTDDDYPRHKTLALAAEKLDDVYSELDIIASAARQEVAHG